MHCNRYAESKYSRQLLFNYIVILQCNRSFANATKFLRAKLLVFRHKLICIMEGIVPFKVNVLKLNVFIRCEIACESQ